MLLYSNRGTKKPMYTDMIRECYLEVLNREPDISGLNTYIARLRRGWSKNDIKDDLFNSPEGQSKLWNHNQNQLQDSYNINNNVVLNSNKPDIIENISNNNNLEEQADADDDTDESITIDLKSDETDNLNDLEYFDYIQEQIMNNWSEYNINKEYATSKIDKGFLEMNSEESTKILYSVKRTTYNYFNIEDSDQEDIIKIFVTNSNSEKMYLKINNINLTNAIIGKYQGSIIQKNNFINDRSEATYFKKFKSDEDKYYLKVHNGMSIDKTLLNIPETNKLGICKYFVIDLGTNLCKLVDNTVFNNSNNLVKCWTS